MNTTLYVIRHGDIDNPKELLYGSVIEFPLTDKGREQLKRLAEKIKTSGCIPQKIYTSHLERALESTDILAKGLGVSDIHIEKDLRDSDIPALAGTPISMLNALYEKGTDEYNEYYVKQGNESKEEITDRIYAVYRKVISQGPDCVAILSHGDPISFLLFKLEHPGEKIPNINFLERSAKSYLPKGHAWKFTLDENGKLLKKELISPD